MTPKTVWAVYFSGTGTTERTVRSVAGELARMRGEAAEALAKAEEEWLDLSGEIEAAGS